MRVYRVDPPSVDGDRESDASVDGVFTATEREVVEMSHYLVRNEGLFVGRVAAANVCGCVRPLSPRCSHSLDIETHVVYTRVHRPQHVP